MPPCSYSNNREMKSKIYQFNPVFYPFKLLVSSSWDEGELKDRFYVVEDRYTVTEASDDFKMSPTTAARSTLVVDKKTDYMYGMVLLDKARMQIGTGVIAHETIHTITNLTHMLGFDKSIVDNDEPHAYFAGWIAECIESVRDGKPLDMDGERFV